MKICAIIPAGGIGKRMKSQQPKQFLTLADRPLLLITLEALISSGVIDRYVIPTVDLVYTKKIIKANFPDLDVHFCKSGKVRQESIYNGLQLIKDFEEEPELILIHDAVRCLVKAETIKNVIDAAKYSGAAIAARPVTDTLKMSYHNDMGHTVIKKNVSRDHMWMSQTPQVFREAPLVEAYEKAKLDHFVGTDSAGLVERIGMEVSLVHSPQSNIKITTPEDLELAEALYKPLN